MEALLLIILIVAAGAGAAIVMRRRSAGGVGQRAGAGAPTLGAGAPASPLGGTAADLRNLKVGDVVHHEGRDWIVEGSLRYEQGGSRWEEHRLADGEDGMWLSVEDDEGLEIALWDRLRGSALEPGAPSIDHEGVTYTLDERGHANFTAEGNTGTTPGGRMEYADYVAGDRMLGFERFGDGSPWEVGVGRPVSEHEFDVYPSRQGHGG